jgi:asparagine synthase (glutamine-hydrolysing)
MRLELDHATARAQGACTVPMREGVLYAPCRFEAALENTEGLSGDQLENYCSQRCIPYVTVGGDSVTIGSDYIGRHHFYLRQSDDRGIANLIVTDDPFEFGDAAPADLEVLRLVPYMKFAPLPLSVVRGVQRVLPATRTTYRRNGWQLVSQRNVLGTLLESDPQAVDSDHIRETLARIVRDCLPDGDVPPHVLLSGGMDSALIVRLLMDHGLRPTAWTAAFDSHIGNLEKARAELSAKAFGIPWRAVRVDRDAAQEHLEGVLDCIIEPFSDIATLPEAIAARAAHVEGGATYAFEGEGMDSLMCGSAKFVTEAYRAALRFPAGLIPEFLLRNSSYEDRWGSIRLKLKKLKQLTRSGAAFERHAEFIAGDVRAHFPDRIASPVLESLRSYYDLAPAGDTLQRLGVMTYWGNLPNLENRKLDVVGRYGDLRLCLPFEDLRFIRLALSIPSRLKVRLGHGKHVMKQAYRSQLPPHVLERRKLSFIPPILDLIHPRYEHLLYNDDLAPEATVANAVREQRAGVADHLAFLWGLVVTNYWLQKFSDRSRSRRDGDRRRGGLAATAL